MTVTRLNLPRRERAGNGPSALRAKIRIFWFGLVCAAAAILFAATARAEIASPWDESLNSRVRLVAGEAAPRGGNDGLYLGIELLIDPDAKTYWRIPGDSGIPPSFDWSQSQNLGAVEVLYPAPKRLADPAGHTVGYKNAVLFPVRVEPRDAARSVDVKLRFSYAVCGTICVPAEANLALSIPAGGEAAGTSARIARGLSLVPRRVAAGGAATARDDVPAVRAVEVRAEEGRKDLFITVAQAAGSRKNDLFLEGPREWYLPLPVQVASRSRGGVEEFDYRVSLNKLPPSASLSGVALRLTVVGDADSLEQDWTLR